MEELELFYNACEFGVMPVFDNASVSDDLDQITELYAHMTVEDKPMGDVLDGAVYAQRVRNRRSYARKHSAWRDTVLDLSFAQADFNAWASSVRQF